MKIYKFDFLAKVKEIAERARSQGMTWGNSTSIPPCRDGYISCDRLVSCAIYELGATGQKNGGFNSAELSVYLPKVGFTKISDRNALQGGDVVMVGKMVNGQRDETYHTFVLTDYNASTGLCSKYDMGSTERIRSAQPFKNVPLVEWSDRWFSMAFRPAAPEGTTAKTAKECIKEGQTALNKYFGAGLKVDGDRKKLTETAFIEAFQDAMNRDYYGDGPMPINGKLTTLTKVALGTHYVEHNEKPKQYLVTIVEIGQLLAGRDPDGVEFPGNYGDGLAKATGKERMTAADILAMFKPELLK